MNSHSSNWTRFPYSTSSFESIVYCGDKFYSLTAGFDFYAIDPLFPTPSAQLLHMDLSQLPDPSFSQAFLVEANEEVLAIVALCTDSVIIERFQVFRADLPNGVWVRVESIGDHVVFLDRFASFTLVADESTGGCRKNCIYYAHWLGVLESEPYLCEPWKTFDIFDLEADSMVYNQPEPDPATYQELISFDKYRLHWIVPRLDCVNCADDSLSGRNDLRKFEETENVMPISTITSSSSSPSPLQKQQHQEETHYTPWLDLPETLTELILKRLPLRYYIRFGSVCRKWRSIQRNHRLRFSPHPPPMDETLPWLIPTCLDHKSPIRCFSSFDSNPSFHGLCVLPNNLNRHPICLGGWILFLRPKKAMLFYNPISGAQIPLPPVSGILDLPVCAAISAPPKSEDSILMIIDYECTVFLYQLNSHYSHWTKFELLRDEPDNYIRNNEVVHSAVYCGGKFYCFTYRYRLYAIDPLFPVQPSPQLIEMDNSQLLCLQSSSAYLVEWDGKLLLVFNIFDDDLIIISFQVFRADFGNNMWIRLENLGDHVLFVDSFCAQMLPAKDGSLMKNCIYYSIWRFDLEPWTLYKIFDLGSDSIICEQQLPDSVEMRDRQHFETNELYWVVPRLEYVD